MKKIKNDLIEVATYVNDKIVSLDEPSQNQIWDKSITPTDPKLMFLDHCYTTINELLEEINML